MAIRFTADCGRGEPSPGADGPGVSPVPAQIATGLSPFSPGWDESDGHRAFKLFSQIDPPAGATGQGSMQKRARNQRSTVGNAEPASSAPGGPKRATRLPP